MERFKMTQYLRKDFTYEYSSQGYMLLYKGHAIGGGGGGISNLAEYKHRAEADMQAILIGKPGSYKNALDEIDAVV